MATAAMYGIAQLGQQAQQLSITILPADGIAQLGMEITVIIGRVLPGPQQLQKKMNTATSGIAQHGTQQKKSAGNGAACNGCLQALRI
jgi:hypothetical protein